MRKQIIVNEDVKQRLNSSGHPIDNIILDTSIGCVLELADPEEEEYYSKWIVEDLSVVKLSDIINQGILKERQRQFKLRSDPLFVEYNLDKTDLKKQEWLSAVDKIKQETPLLKLNEEGLLDV